MERKRLKNVPRSAWLVVGVCIAAVVMPTAAVATALSYTGIEGTSHNKADVSTAGQVLTAPATPSNYYATGQVVITGSPTAVATAPAGDGLVLTSLNISVSSFTTGANYQLLIGNAACTVGIGGYSHVFTPASGGDTEITFSPGVVIPSGDALCGNEVGASVAITPVGYTGSSAAIP
jgi:hypothetical protein